MRNLIYVFVILMSVIACEDKIGYLLVDDAAYDPLKMTIKSASDLDEEADADRIRLQYPWVSPGIQGVLGTLPILYYLDGVHSSDGDINSFLKYAKMREGDGSIEIPFEHSIKKGTYVIGVKFSNEGYTLSRDSMFSVIVQ